MHQHPTFPDPRSHADRIISTSQAITLTSLSRSTMWRLEIRGAFPRRVRVSTNRVGYRLGDVLAWLAARPDACAMSTVGV